MKVIKRKNKHNTREQRKKKRTKFFLVVCTICIFILIAYQAITGIINNDWQGGLNYYGQPVDPGLQLVVLISVIVIGIIWIWQQIFGKKEQKQKKKAKHKYSYVQYPHERIGF